MNAKVVVLAILILLAVVVMFQNRQPVPIQLLFWSISMPRILLIFIILLIGFAAGFISSDIRSRKSGGD